MKVRSLVSLLVLFVLLLNSTGVYAQLGGTQVGAKTLKFDKEKFIAKVNENKLGAPSPLDGYAAVIIKDGRIVAETAGGLAIRGDGNGVKNALMTTSTPSDIGSDFKMISFITLLSVFEKRAAKNPALTIEKQSNSPILPYLPKAWRAWVNTPPDDTAAAAQATARIAKTTFAQLMQHKSGFRSVTNKTSPFDYIDKGIQQSDIGVRKYSNFNATVLTYLWPRLVDPAKADQIEKQIEAANVANNNHEVYGKLYGDFFENWMQKNVFDVIRPGIRPSCDPAVDFPKRTPAVVFARYYDNPLGGDNPRYWSEKDKNHGCHAQGGYYLSMRDLAAFMANYQATNTLVSDKVRKMMYDDSTAATRDDSLGWSEFLSSPFATKNFGVNAIPWKAGGNLGFTAVVQLPDNYIAVGTISGPGNEVTVANTLKDAWVQGMIGNFE
ncbi:MAG: beta-lactamase family protein [Acidobacteria bacterium]|nr:beta-lactamase family protein [Acidobacteriota bacterium]